MTAEGFDIEYFGGESEIERGLASAGPLASGDRNEKPADFLKIGGSKVLQSGGPGRNRPLADSLLRIVRGRTAS